MPKYRCIVADPPWPYNSPRAVVGNGGRGKEGAAEIIQSDVTQHYNTMTIKELCSLPVKRLAYGNSHLYLWTTNSFMVEAHEVARAWGFEPKTIITWVKKKPNGQPSMKTGFYYRGATEHCVFAVMGSLRLMGPPHPTVFETPRLPHSVKPDYFYEMVEQQSLDERLELFARKKREGWDAWGDQVESDITLNGN